MKYRSVVACVLLSGVFAAAAWGADAGGAPAGVEEPVPLGSSQSAQSPAAPSTLNDTVVLTNGRILQNVRVLGRTTDGYEVEIVEGAVTMTLPRRTVESIQYGARRPAAATSDAPPDSPPPAVEDLAPLFPDGDSLDVMVPRELLPNLNKDITDKAADYANQDLIEVMTSLSAVAGLKIRVDKPVTDLPAEERLCKFELDPDTPVTVASLLYRHLLRQPEFRGLVIRYHGDQLVLTSAEPAGE